MENHPLEQLIEEYLSEKDVTTQTKEVYKVALNQYIDYLNNHKILFASTIDLVKFLDSRREKGCSDRWLYALIRTIKDFINI